MTLLVAGLVVFFAVHALPWKPALRIRVIDAVGPLAYRGLFSIVAGIGLAMTIAGYGAATPGEVLWAPATWGQTAAHIFVPIAFVFVVSAYLGSNARLITAHPMLWGVSLWAVVHLLNNGDVPSVLLFGGFLVYAVLDMISATRRGAARAAERLPLWRDALATAVGFGAAFAVIHFHGALFGVAVVP